MHALMSAGERNGRARLLIGDILGRHGLYAHWDRQDWAEVVAELPVQNGLSFPLVLAFQKENELLLDVLGFRQILSPWPEAGAERLFLRMVDGLLSGKGRLLRYLTRSGQPWKLTLEELDPDLGWCRLKTIVKPRALPLLALGGLRIDIRRNAPDFQPIRLITDRGRPVSG